MSPVLGSRGLVSGLLLELGLGRLELKRLELGLELELGRLELEWRLLAE